MDVIWKGEDGKTRFGVKQEAKPQTQKTVKPKAKPKE